MLGIHSICLFIQETETVGTELCQTRFRCLESILSVYLFRRRKLLVQSNVRPGFDACLESILSVYLFRRRKLLVQSNVRSGFDALNPFYLFIYSGDGNCWYRAMSDQVSMLGIPNKPTKHWDLRKQVADSLKVIKNYLFQFLGLGFGFICNILAF